jgi:hypothetical protein
LVIRLRGRTETAGGGRHFVIGSGSFRQSISGEDGFACKALIFVLAQFRTQNRFAFLPELL